MSAVRTIRKPPQLMQIMRANGGIHAGAALAQALTVMKSMRATNVSAIAGVMEGLNTWRDLAAPTHADWQALYEAGTEIIVLCDPEQDAHLLRSARLLCEYVERTTDELRSLAIGALFISTMKAVTGKEVDNATRAQVMHGLEALIKRENSLRHA